MRTICIAILAIGSLAMIFGAAGDTAYGQRRLKVVEEYDINPGEYQINPRTEARRIENLYLYDAAEKIAERWDFLGNYYRRHVFSRDRKGRTSADLVYESVPLGENGTFTVERSSSGVKVLPTVSDTLIEITLTEYDGRDHEIEERTTDGEGVLKRKVTREFDRYGTLTFLREVDGKGTVVGQEYRTTCSSDGRQCENVGRADDGSIVKGKIVCDAQHRLVLEETYRYPSAKSKEDKPWIIGRSVWSYNADLTNLDWYLFRDDGTPTQRLMVVHKGDREISRRTFAPASNLDGSASWIPDSEELRECTFDKSGACIREIWKQRKSGDKAFKFTFVHEQVVSWH